MREDFCDRTAFVTGAGGGIGQAIAEALSHNGCRVIACDIKPKPEDMRQGDGEIDYVTGDITREDDILRSLRSCDDTGLDFIVNAAGIALMGQDGSIVDIDMDVWQRTMNVNLMGAILTARHGVPRLLERQHSSIVHIASVVGLRSMDNAHDDTVMDAYQISKAALISLSRGLALAYGRRGLRSNTVCPGAIWTPMTDHIYKQSRRVEAMQSRTPIGRLGLPSNIADSTLFLLSQKASFITGTDLVVDGGLMAKLS